MSDPAAVLACDLGGTILKLAVVAGGSIVVRSELPARSNLGLAPRLDDIAAELRSLAGRAGVDYAASAGVSIAIPGIVDTAGARVVRVPGKFEDAPDLDLVRWAGRELGLGAVLENDARAAAVGEWRLGAGAGCDDVIAITLGTGIGVGVVCAGQVLRGPHGGAGILAGHTSLARDGRRCTCGMVGCAEAEASTWALAGLAAEHGLASTSGTPLEYEELFALAASGVDAAVGIREHSLSTWASLVVNLVHAYDPQRVVVGGGISRAPEVVPAIRAALECDPWSSGWDIAVVASDLGPDAALLAGPWLLAESGLRAERPT